MRSSGSLVRFVAALSARRFLLGTLALPALLFAVGCDRALEPDLADHSAAVPAASIEAAVTESETGSEAVTDQIGISLAEVEATVPNEPVLETKVEPAPELKPLPPAPESLGIGDASPGLHLAKFIKGDPVDETLAGKVHVVEFWATWCGPCLAGMPHLSELQTEYGDEVTFLGVTREDEPTVAKFLNRASPGGPTWDEVIKYRLALDDRDWTNTAFMTAAGQNGIPCAFVVGGDGIVEWIGHPMTMDEPLRKIVDGTWDRAAAIAEFKQQERIKQIMPQVSQAARSGEWDAALKLIDELESEIGESKTTLRYRLLLLESAGRDEEAAEARSRFVDASWDDPQQLNEIAWNAATSGKPERLELALKAAVRASELKNDEDAMILDTLARCHYELGNLDEAIKWQQKAVEHNQGLREIDDSLKRYLDEKSAATEPVENPEASESESSEAPGENP